MKNMGKTAGYIWTDC